MKSINFYRVLKFLLLILIFISGVNGARLFGQSREALIKAGYIEKFTHFIQWPKQMIDNDSITYFVISVYGANTFGSSLEELFSEIKINNKKVIINYISSIDEIKNSMILFISESEEKNLYKILAYTTGKPILTIGDCKGYGEKGVLINLFMEGYYLRYEVNQNSLEKSGLKINSLLLNYAVIIK